MRVLVIEDERNIVEYLRQALTAEGFAVDAAYDGASGLDKALTGEYDAITLDIMLPEMNGYDVCRNLREAGNDTPVLMLTAKDGEYDEADAFDMGADDFLRKPFSLVVLVARLRALIRRSAAATAAPVLTCGDLSYDQRSRSVSRAGTPIELTPRELSLLEFMMHNQGQALTRAQILTHVWGVDATGEENLIEVYIGYLRKKIDAPFNTHSIKTIRGTGYMLVEERSR